MTDAITKTTLAQLVEALETCITVTTGPGMSEQLYNVPKVIKAISDGKAALAAPQPMVTPYISQAHFDRVFPPEPQPVKQANEPLTPCTLIAHYCKATNEKWWIERGVACRHCGIIEGAKP